MNIKKLYNLSPIFMQNFMVTTSGYQRNLNRYGKAYYEHRKFLEQFDGWSLDQKLEYQRKELISLVQHTNNNSPFYRRLYKDIDLPAIKYVEDLKLLPIVDKEMLRENIEDVVTISRKKAVEGHTGGTTGKSLVVYSRVEDSMKRMAVLDHFKARVGFEHRKMKRATFNGKHIIPPGQGIKVFWRYNHACKQMIYSSFHLTEENMRYYVESLNMFRPQAIDGFFMSMCDIAGYIERHNIKLDFTPVAIFPTSETLTKPGRELLERAFNCKVYDQYASSEGAPFVTECEHQKLHIELSTGVFEQLNENSNEILVTSFTTYGTPLIRYRIGDSMIFSHENYSCTCGREGLIIKEIQGRRLDYLYTAGGGKISAANIANGFKNVPNAIIRAQVVQDRVGEILISIEIDKNRYESHCDDVIIKEFENKFGNDTKVFIRHVDSISREVSGKYRLVVNNVKY